MYANYHYTLQPSPFGAVGVVWKTEGKDPKIHRIFLPAPRLSVEALIQSSYPGIPLRSCRPIASIAKRILRFLEGEDVSFALASIALNHCPPFQQRVLLAESKIPRGFVSTYGRLAKHLGHPLGAQAVGQALANNPFPIIIPCHRAIRSNGELGGFQGGQEMKHALLAREGIEFSPSGKVVMTEVYY
jgi:methylated-DNA-[protein]-cysteine S-methyltransferase